MLIDNEDELKKKKEEARQLRNSFGMVTDNDKKIYGNDNFSFSDSTSSISNKHDSEDFSTTQNNSYSQRLEEAKKIRNSFGMTTTKDSGNDDFMNFSKDDDTITTIHQKDDNNISGTPKYYDTNIDNIEKTANTDTSINENTETQGESKTKKTDNNPSITRKVDQLSYKNIGLSVANPEQTQNAKPIVDYTLQQQKEEKDSQNIFVKAGTWIKDLFGSIGVSIKNTATGLYKTAKEGYDERKEAVDNMSESDIQNSSNKNKILADTIAPNTFLTNTNNNENLNSQKTKLIINDTIQDVSRSTANGLIGIANNVLNFLTFGTLSKDTIKKIPDFSVLQNSEQYGEYSSQEELTNSIQNDKKQDLADYGLYNPSANAVADITVDIAEFLLLKKAGLGSTSAMVTSGTANTLGETGNVEDATKSAVSNYVFSKVLDNKLINEKLGNAVFNGTKGKVVEALGKHGELLDADTQMKIVKGLSSASATFSETFVSRILTNELQSVGDYGNDVYNKDVQKNILVDGVIWSAIYAGISGFSGAYAKVDVEQSNINDAEAKRQLENCYSIMELDSSKEYTIEELNKQRKKLVKKYHPDLAGGSNEKMATINNAYDVLNKYITEGVIDKVVIHTESSNTPPKEDNIKEKQNGMVVTKDGQIYVDSNDILKQTATNIAKSQISPAITTIVDKDNNLTGLEQVNVVPFEVENSKVPTITPAIYVSDDGSINVIDTNTGTKLLTNAKDADTAIETVTKALQSNDESNIRNIENEVTKNSIQVEQAIGNIIDKINEKTGKNNTQYVAFYPEQIKNIDNTSPTNNVDIRYLKSLTSQDSVSKINVNNIPKAVDTELGKTNAEREDSYIEKEIQKVESKGNWDNSIPVTKLSDINKTIEDYLQLKIKKGRFRQDAYGIYKDKRDVLRVQEYKDIDTALHEAGHAMDLGKRINVDKESISEELLNAIDKYGGYEGEPRSIKLDEGFAEVIREYGIKPEEAKKDYPNTIAILENMRMQDKSFDDFISKVQKMTYNYIHQSPRNRTLSNISVGEQTDKKVWNKKTIKTEIMRNIFDSDYALKTAVADLAKASGKKVSDIKATENAYILTRLASGIGERVTSILADGLIDENGEKRFEGLNKIGDILGKNPERYNDLRAYLVAQRDTEYKTRTLRTGIRSMDSQSVINQFKNDSQIKEASKIIYNALDGVLQYAVDNHLLTSENAEALRESNAFYVPMQRVLENDRGNNVGNRGRVNDIIKKRTGSELDVKDVLENIISNSSNIIRQVENNNVLKALYKQGEESGLTGAVYDVIPAPMFKVGTQTLATWEKELKRQGVNTENLDLQKSIDIFSPSNKVDSKNLITSFIDDNGKRKYLQFYDEDVFNNLMGMDRKFMSKILSISSKLNMPLRFGATMGNIGFAIPNMISDTAQAAVYSTAGFIPVVDNAIGVLNILAVENKHVEKFLNQIAPEYTKKVNFMYELYKQSGAPSSTRLSQYRKSTQSIMNEIYGTKSSTLGIKESFKPLKRTLDMLSYIPDISEQSTRFRVYQKNYNYYKRKGNSEMDSRIMAAIESRDATQDFGRTGNITKEVNQAIPFSAARIGSSYTFAEKVSDNPKKVGFRIAMLTATALAISAMGYNSTKIQELNQRKKDDNFVFDIGDNVITIKKPQGVLRSIINLAEYIQDLATGHIEEGKEGERLGTWLNNAIMDNMPADEVTGLVPNAVAPLIENAINKDFYYNTDIVKSYDLDLPESEQYYDYNSQLSKWIGSIFNYSPAKIDNLISGYFGGLGTSVTNTIDYVLGKMGVIPEQAEMGAERNSVGKRFFVNVNSNSKSLDELYNTKDELTKKKNGGTITSEETKQLEKINEASSQIADINKKIKSIKSDEYLDGQEKAEKIKALQSERTDTARQALGKELMDTSNKTRIESTKFYPSNSTLKQNKYTLTLTDEMKNEYERIAYERYSQYSGQSLYNEDYLQKLETKCKDYAKNYMMQKYKSQLVKSK